MTDILRALATSAAVLLPVIVFFILAGMAAVRRGEGGTHHHAPAPAVAEVAPTTQAAAPREFSVIELLLLGTALFALAMIGLLAVSLLGHL